MLIINYIVFAFFNCRFVYLGVTGNLNKNSMRDHYQVDWAFAVRNSIEKVVQENFPPRRTPLAYLKGFQLRELFA
jgi:hypothetical protein